MSDETSSSRHPRGSGPSTRPAPATRLARPRLNSGGGPSARFVEGGGPETLSKLDSRFRGNDFRRTVFQRAHITIARPRWHGLLGLALAAFVGAHPARGAEGFTRPPPFSLPAHYGEITDAWHPGPDKTKADYQRTPYVVLIQDLHANVGVQKNIASILYRLNRLNGGRGLLVCVEGASGEGDVSLLRSLPGPIRHGFEAMLLHRAYLTGAELAATESAADWPQQQNVIWHRIKSWFVTPSGPAPVSLTPIHLWGVDDPELYRKNWRAAKTVDQLHFPALEYLRPTKAFLQEGASPELQKHLSLLTKLLLLRLQPDEYAEYLRGRAMNPRGAPAYQQTLSAAETYYQAADARSVAMTKNLLQKMGGRPGITALVTGGFHTKQIAAALQKKSLGYAVVTPRVEVLDQDMAYRARLREEE